MTTTSEPEVKASQKTQPEAQLLLKFNIQWEFDVKRYRIFDIGSDPLLFYN